MKFLKAFGKFLMNWVSEASVVLITIASIAVAAYMIYFLTGRAPKEDMSWLLDYSSRCVVIALAITFTSVSREAWGFWYTAKELIDRPMVALIQAAQALAIFLSCLWVLMH